MPKRTDIQSILIIGAGPIVIGQACEFDYSGTQACKALKAEGYRIVLVNSNPATIMTDPELADATYVEPITPEIVAKIIERERPDALLPTMGGQTALNTALGAREAGRARQVRRRADRRPGAIDRQGRGPPALPRGDDAHRSRDAQVDARRQPRAGAGRAGARRPAGDRAAVVHAGRHGRRRRLQPGGVRRDRRARPRRLAGAPGAGRGERARLERVRDGGGARHGGQLHHRLLDRERRPHGRAHRQLDHGGAGADAHRQGIPDHAQRLDRGVARDRGGHRRLQRAVRRQSGRRPPRHHRDEPARVALFGACIEGDGVPDRQGRGQARRRLHAGRARERHHRRGHARLLRAHHRLRRHQDPALRLREISRRRADADNLHEIGGRGDGDRAHLRREPAEGAARAGVGPHRPRRPGAGGARAGRRQERDPRRAGPAHAGSDPEGGAGHAARRRP